MRNLYRSSFGAVVDESGRIAGQGVGLQLRHQGSRSDQRHRPPETRAWAGQRQHPYPFEAAPYFIEMDCGGPDLARWEREAGLLKSSSRDDRIALFLKIADGVSALHSADPIRADLKPSNILIDSAGAARPGCA